MYWLSHTLHFVSGGISMSFTYHGWIVCFFFFRGLVSSTSCGVVSCVSSLMDVIICGVVELDAKTRRQTNKDTSAWLTQDQIADLYKVKSDKIADELVKEKEKDRESWRPFYNTMQVCPVPCQCKYVPVKSKREKPSLV